MGYCLVFFVEVMWMFVSMVIWVYLLLEFGKVWEFVDLKFEVNFFFVGVVGLVYIVF